MIRQGPGSFEHPQQVFVDGFSWRTVVGGIFVGIVMIPASLYLALVVGQTLGPAAEWVTIILFTEAARRSFASLKKQEIFILYYVASGLVMAGVSGVLMGGGIFSGMLWNQYLVQSPQAVDFGVAEHIPPWAAPPADSEAVQGRMLWHRDWWAALALVLAGQVLGRLNWFGLGYVLFRFTADFERLPFPLAPIAAEGATALAEADEEDSWRWPVFSVGTVAGLLFGFLYVGVPALTGLIMSEPLMIFPIPFVDFTQSTEPFLPTALTAISWDLGAVVVGFVLPFALVAGMFISAVATSIFLNPILYKAGFFPNWKSGLTLLPTKMTLDFDFWLSMGIGTGLAVALLGLGRLIPMLFARRDSEQWRRGAPPPGRGDFPIWLGLLLYFIGTTGLIALCRILVPAFPLWILCVFGYLWTPLNSYISARLIGLTGQGLAFPFLREGTFILSGYRGVDIWFAPIPLGDYGGFAQRFRELELTGTKIQSIIKAELLIIPISIVCSFAVCAFFWRISPIPSALYPFTARIWPINATWSCMFFTATQSENPLLLQAIKPAVIAAGTGVGLLLYVLVTGLGGPPIFFYGLLGGMGAIPNAIIPMFAGALLGRYVLAKQFGEERWRRFAPVVAAGFACGVGLMGMVAVAAAMVDKAVTSLPF